MTAIYNKFPQISRLLMLANNPIKCLTAHFKWKLKLGEKFYDKLFVGIKFKGFYCFMKS
jgi:hypothetical protein